nr:hypothetical protein [Sneathiella limimaris]
MKVSVMDPVSLTEVSIVGPRTASQQELQRTAVQKLHYVLSQKQSAKDKAEENNDKPGRGIIV